VQDKRGSELLVTAAKPVVLLAEETAVGEVAIACITRVCRPATRPKIPLLFAVQTSQYCEVASVRTGRPPPPAASPLLIRQRL
jgi:hypothetical protein